MKELKRNQVSILSKKLIIYTFKILHFYTFNIFLLQLGF